MRPGRAGRTLVVERLSRAFARAKEDSMPATPAPHEEHAHPEQNRRDRTWFRQAQKGGLLWRRRSPNQRYVPHRRGNR
jgi:hypothetical protein